MLLLASPAVAGISTVVGIPDLVGVLAVCLQSFLLVCMQAFSLFDYGKIARKWEL
jgi:hypothetical protein